MSHWICVPIKPFEYGKSRLEELLTFEQRIRLNRALFSHTLKAIQQSKWSNNGIVISKGSEALQIARRFGFLTIIENPPYGLNRSLRKVIKESILESATSLTIIPSDLPLLTTEELNDLFDLRIKQNGLIIVPDQKMEGTNILSIMPLDSISFQYGRDSFQKHINSARSASIQVTIQESILLGIDLDTEADLIEILAINPNIIDEIPELGSLQTVIQPKGVRNE